MNICVNNLNLLGNKIYNNVCSGNTLFKIFEVVSPLTTCLHTSGLAIYIRSLFYVVSGLQRVENWGSDFDKHNSEIIIDGFVVWVNEQFKELDDYKHEVQPTATAQKEVKKKEIDAGWNCKVDIHNVILTHSLQMQNCMVTFLSGSKKLYKLSKHFVKFDENVTEKHLRIKLENLQLHWLHTFIP